MISEQDALEIAMREMGRGSEEISLKEFDEGFLFWVKPSRREDPTSAPSEVGGSYLIVDKADGQTSTWPMLGATMAIDQYRRARRGDKPTWEYEGPVSE